jgi:hypothetical protein
VRCEGGNGPVRDARGAAALTQADHRLYTHATNGPLTPEQIPSMYHAGVPGRCYHLL